MEVASRPAGRPSARRAVITATPLASAAMVSRKSSSGCGVGSLIARGRSPHLLPEERAVEQEAVQPDDERCDDGGDCRGERAVDEVAHEVAAAGEEDRRHERERDAEGEHDLRDDERARGSSPSPSTTRAGAIVSARRRTAGWRAG